MKDWDIKNSSFMGTKSGTIYKEQYLVHIHEHELAYRVYEEKDEKWRCTQCGAEAPEEMAFVALLARCRGRYRPLPPLPPGY